MIENMQSQTEWYNVLLTDSGLYYDNELDKPMDILITRFKAMLQKSFAEARVLFIPTAAMQDDIKANAIITRLKNELLALGILSENITVYDIDGSLTEEDAMSFDVIYFTGGNTPYLAKRVREVGFEHIILKMIYANKVYIGMSAGSMLLMPNFNVDDIYNPEFMGLGLINAYFTVHCEAGTQNRSDLPLPHIALRENQAIELHWDGYKLIESNLQYEP
jgi:peptidase E